MTSEEKQMLKEAVESLDMPDWAFGFGVSYEGDIASAAREYDIAESGEDEYEGEAPGECTTAQLIAYLLHRLVEERVG